MDFLDLVQRTAQECGAASVPSSCQSQSGEALRFVNWVNQAWDELQMLRDDWGFMRSSYLQGSPVGGTTFTTTAGVYYYPLGTTAGSTCMVDPDEFSKWDPYSFRCYTTSNTDKSDEIQMRLISFDDWRNGYLISALRQVETRPYVVAIGPDMAVNIGPPSDGTYTIEGDYWVKPTLMSDNDDEPSGLPREYQMMIVYRAMKKYAGFESAPEVFQTAHALGRPLEYKLVRTFGRGITRRALA